MGSEKESVINFKEAKTSSGFHTGLIVMTVGDYVLPWSSIKNIEKPLFFDANGVNGVLYKDIAIPIDHVDIESYGTFDRSLMNDQ